MSETCSGSCGSCGVAGCALRTEETTIDFREKLANISSVKHVYAIMSGKGGVGKSMVTSLLASNFQKRGHSTAILDADITGPSIPTAFGIEGLGLDVTADGKYMIPARSLSGIQIVSGNLLLADSREPIIWRGAMISGAVRQFWGETYWQDVDIMFVDMPPGTGDVPLTVFQSLPVDGIIVVTSPQELVSMIVTKAVNMAKRMNIPIVGLVENMSYAECPDCGKKLYVFGESHIDETAKEHGLSVLAKIPIARELSELTDAGKIEYADASILDRVAENIIKIDSAVSGLK